MRAKRRVLILSIAILTLNGCGASLYYTSDPIEARVVDADTGNPIEGAIVTANWQLVGFSFDTDGRKVGQLAVMEEVTDKNGRFFLPGFTRVNWTLGELREQDPLIRIFKSGYKYSGASSDYKMTDPSPGSHRHSRANGMVFKLPRADADAEKYGRDLSVLTIELAAIQRSGDGAKIARMLTALRCENKRLSKIDPKAGFSVPAIYGMETRCENQ